MLRRQALKRTASIDVSRARREASLNAAPLPDDAYDYRIGRAQDVLTDIMLDTIPLILTDPSWRADAEPQLEWLGDFAAHDLLPGGSLICHIGHSMVFRAHAIFTAAGLRYWRQLVVLHDQRARQPGLFVYAGYNPVLWFVKGTRGGRTMIDDVLVMRSSLRDKSEHPWARGEAGATEIIAQLTEPGDLIVDPFAGTGYWGRIATSMGRRWIGCDVVRGGSTQVVL